MEFIILAIKAVVVKIGTSIGKELCSSKIKDISTNYQTFYKNHKKIIRIIILIIIIIIFSGSMMFNVYWLKRSKSINDAIKDTIQNVTQPIIDSLGQTNTEINKTAQESLDKIKTEISSSEVMVSIKDTSKIEEKDYVTIHVDGVDYNYELQDELSKSKEQVKFISSQMSALSVTYEEQTKAKDELIDKTKKELENAQKELTKKITETEVNMDIAQKTSNAIKFGIGACYSSQIGNLSNRSLAVNLNALFYTKINISTGLGMSIIDKNVSPNFNIGVTYYF